MNNKIIHIRKRTVSDIDFLSYPFSVMFISGLLSFVSKDSTNNWIFEIFFPCFILSVIVFVCCGTVFTTSANNLLKEGQVIWATVDIKMLHYDGTMLSVYCYEEKDGHKTYYKATARFRDRGLVPTVKSLLIQEGMIPVVVASGNPESYIVLLKEIIDMCDSNKGNRSRTDIIRGIGWMKNE